MAEFEASICISRRPTHCCIRRFDPFFAHRIIRSLRSIICKQLARRHGEIFICTCVQRDRIRNVSTCTGSFSGGNGAGPSASIIGFAGSGGIMDHRCDHLLSRLQSESGRGRIFYAEISMKERKYAILCAAPDLRLEHRSSGQMCSSVTGNPCTSPRTLSPN
jgi:hypothetical protein